MKKTIFIGWTHKGRRCGFYSIVDYKEMNKITKIAKTKDIVLL